MDIQIGFWVLLGVGGVLVALVSGLSYLCVKYRTRYLKSLEARRQSMDLELATSDQLLKELRKRPLSYIMLRPDRQEIPGGTAMTLEAEVHNINPISSAGLLHMAAQMSIKQIKDSPEGQEFMEFLEGDDDDIPPWLKG